jgi:hypothetical protein
MGLWIEAYCGDHATYVTWFNGRTGYEQVTGNSPDILEWLDFDFYEMVWYYDRKHPDMTDDDRSFAYWLGV